MSGIKKISKDNYLFREGDQPDAMYIIKSGALSITKAKGTSEIVLAEIGPGQMVGEMAIFDRKPRSANVKAAKESEVIALPYVALEQQLDALPTWIKAIMKTMNENLREANKKIKILETTTADEDRFPPHVVNKLLSLINFVSHRFGQKEGEFITFSSNKLRNFTIQIFQEPTNKMEAMQNALKSLGMFDIEDLGEGRKKLTNKKPDFLFDFVDWYNEWLFKQDKEKVSLSDEEAKILTGLLKYSSKLEINPKGFRKVNLADLQNDSMKDLGFLMKGDDLNGLIEKKLLPEKIMEEGGVFVNVHSEELQKIATNWSLIWDLKKLLK